MKAAQVSLEYLAVVAISFLLLVPGLYFMLEYTKGTAASIKSFQVNQVGHLIIDSANTVDGYGRDARLVIQIEMPDGIKNISAHGKSLSMDLLGQGSSLFTSKVNMTVVLQPDDYSSGMKRYRIESRGDYVLLTRV
jgi:uncharacterized protein (UPF0333 family)